MSNGYSGGVCFGSHPKKVGRRLTPASTNPSVELGMGGNCWCEVAKRVLMRWALYSTDVPLSMGGLVKNINDSEATHFGHPMSLLASTATITSTFLALTNMGPRGIFSRFEEPSINSNQLEFESRNTPGFNPWNGCTQKTIMRK